jgi:hypothetical protein
LGWRQMWNTLTSKTLLLLILSTTRSSGTDLTQQHYFSCNCSLIEIQQYNFSCLPFLFLLCVCVCVSVWPIHDLCSWLAFNWRVLHMALDVQTPLFEVQQMNIHSSFPWLEFWVSNTMDLLSPPTSFPYLLTDWVFS